LDETELCTDSEMLEAALLQRQKQQAHAERLQQQEWLLMSSYDSSSASKQLDAAGAGRITPSQQQQGMGVRGGSSSTSVVGGGSNAGTRNAEAAGLPPSDTPVSVTSITAAALDKHMQQQQAATIMDSAALHQQQQQAHHPSSAERQGPDLLIQPSELQGHFILTGCGSSFVQFARQLAASASPAAEPLTVVLLHPEHPGALAVELIGRTICFVSLSGPVASTGAVAARSGSACRYTSYFAGRLCTVSVDRENRVGVCVCVCMQVPRWRPSGAWGSWRIMWLVVRRMRQRFLLQAPSGHVPLCTSVPANGLSTSR
jgi:hypothetical protein